MQKNEGSTAHGDGATWGGVLVGSGRRALRKGFDSWANARFQSLSTLPTNGDVAFEVRLEIELDDSNLPLTSFLYP
jgi:hypothetical protein